MDQWFHFKGTQTSCLHTVTTCLWQQSVSSHLYQRKCDWTLNHNSVYLSLKWWQEEEVEEEEEGSDKGERKSIRLSAFTANIQSRFVIPQLLYSEVYCIFEFRLNWICVFFIQPERCSSRGMGPHMAERKWGKRRTWVSKDWKGDD